MSEPKLYVYDNVAFSMFSNKFMDVTVRVIFARLRNAFVGETFKQLATVNNRKYYPISCMYGRICPEVTSLITIYRLKYNKNC